MIKRLCHTLEIQLRELPRFLGLTLWGAVKMFAWLVLFYAGTVGFVLVMQMWGSAI